MALFKQMTDEKGIITNYHNLGSVTIRGNSLECVIYSFPSREYRETSVPAVVSHTGFVITLEEEESMGARKLAYTKLKSLPEWEDAEDC